jgi:gas vesicle protein
MSTRDGVGLFFVGLLVGALSGAIAALLLAPQSGAETRVMIKDKSIELRDKAQQTAGQARAKTNEYVSQIKDQVQSVRGNGASQPEPESVAA